MFEIGNSLREARARRKLSYDQVEAETKIRAKYIRCLEDEDFDVLPSGTYVKGFLRTYADYLGLDGQLYVDEYNSRFGDLHAEDQLFRRRERPQTRRRRHESSNVVLIALAGIVAVAVLFFVAFTFGGNQQKLDPTLAPLVPTNVQPLSNDRLPPTVTQHHATKKKRRTTHVAPPPRTVTVSITAQGGDCWFQLERGAGPQVLYGQTLTSGTSTGPYISRTGFTLLNVGVPENLRVTVNGRSFTLTGSAPWRVTKAGVRSLAPPSTTTGTTTGTTTAG